MLLGLVGLLVSGLPGAAAAGRHANGVIGVSGKVLYLKRQCFSDPSKRVETPLAGAKVLLHRAGGADVTTTLDHAGAFHGRVRGHGPVTATVVLSGRPGSVTPGAKGSQPYHLPIGSLHAGSNAPVVLRGNGPAGAANIWMVVSAGAAVAERASPVPISPVHVAWRYNADFSNHSEEGHLGTSAYDYATNTLYVDGTKSRQDQWEPFVLLHEYGHHVLLSVANPGKSASGTHNWHLSYPTQPAMPWSEGFANAFAGIVLRQPRLSIDCNQNPGDLMDIGSLPATPEPQNPRYAMTSETADAGVVWHLALHLGAGNPQKGLAPLLDALHRYRRNGHPAQDMRDVRDALIEAGLEHDSAAEHQELDSIFADEGIGFGIGFESDFEDDGNNQDSDAATFKMQINGPYGCETGGDTYTKLSGAGGGQWFGEVVGGGLPYTWQDDCLGADTVSTGAWLLFPYAKNLAHRSGSWSVTFSYECTKGYIEVSPGSYLYNNCDTIVLDLSVAQSLWSTTFSPNQTLPGKPMIPGGEEIGLQDAKSANRLAGGPDATLFADGTVPSDPSRAGLFQERVVVANHQKVTAVLFSSSGAFCQLIQAHTDCGV
jgi:hypothetical protein